MHRRVLSGEITLAGKMKMNTYQKERKNTDMNKQKTTNTHKYNHNTNGPDTGLPFTVKLKCDKIA